jgi:hypothetical protein
MEDIDDLSEVSSLKSVRNNNLSLEAIDPFKDQPKDFYSKLCVMVD